MDDLIFYILSPFLIIALLIYLIFAKDDEKKEENLDKLCPFPPLLKFNEDGTVEEMEIPFKKDEDIPFGL